MSSRALMTTWSSVANGNVIRNPSRSPAWRILPCGARQEFLYSGAIRSWAELISKASGRNGIKSLRLDALFANDGAPARRFGFDESGKFALRIADRVGAQAGHLLLHRG